MEKKEKIIGIGLAAVAAGAILLATQKKEPGTNKGLLVINSEPPGATLIIS